MEKPEETGVCRKEPEGRKKITFILREIHNQTKQVIHKSSPRFEKGPRSQLQGGILGYLYHHRDGPVYQKDLEKEFRISRATATNTLQVMERNGLIIRRAQDKDARLKRIQLTEEAYQNHRQIEAHMNMMERRMLEGMTDEETAELHRLLKLLQRNLEAMDAECSSGVDDAGESFPDMPENEEASIKE